MPFRRRHRRWIALIALLGLLFQQLAMAVYVCPIESDGRASVAGTPAMAPCGSPDISNKIQCEQHCHPLAQTSDHATPPTVPAALLPATTWLREASVIRIDLPASLACEVDAHAAAPPLIIQHCTFQI
ncbi:MAG: hypothetical protein E6K53_12310 [Gammaproteobacteria bacterium]|nr:MAG: hypothetical protein E6K53_12310 [Gammaproteobacteria bacterium]